MRRSKKLRGLLWAGDIVASVAIVASGVTFAALQGQQNILTGNTSEYKLQITMANDAVEGDSASLGNIDFAFSGVAVSN